MKVKYPDYKNKETFKEVFNSFTQHNQKIINKFMDYCSITAGENSLCKIKAKVVQISDIFGKELDKLNLDDFRKFLALLNKSDRAIATKNDTIKTLKRFLRFQYSDWSKRFDNLKDGKTNTKNEGRNISKADLLTPDEMQIILKSIDSLKYKTILMLMQETANRPEEILKLKWKDINLDVGEVKLNSSKTGETRNIPLNESVPHLQRYKKECFVLAKNDNYTFPSPYGKDKPLTPQSLNQFLSKLEKRIEFKKHLYPYLWRHSILSRMIKTLTPKVYEMYAGHSLETGMKTYAHLNTDDLRDELKKKVYLIEELTINQKEEFGKKIKQLEEKDKQQQEKNKQHEGKINSLLKFEDKAFKISRQNSKIVKLLIKTFQTSKDSSNKELLKELKQIYAEE